MKLLKNGCRRSEIKVIPSNWKKTTSVRKDWMIYYRFYHDDFTGPGKLHPKGKLVTERGMNCFKTARERQSYVITILEEIRHELDDMDYNPITGYKKNFLDIQPEYEIHPDTPFLDALQRAYEKRKVSPGVKKDLRSVLKYTAIAAKNIKLDLVKIKDIRRRHMKGLLDQLAIVKKETWTANNHNFYRVHLMMLFDELCEWETIESNPIDKISKMKHAVAKRPTLTIDQRKAINEGLRKDNYRLWLFMQIFFLSGARETEMVLVKHEDVNINEQRVKYTILKGNQYKQEFRPIPDNAINLWEQALVGSVKGQYLFSRGLTPGDKSIRPEQITRRWRRWVKDKKDDNGKLVYGTDIADFYSLKHSHSTELSSKVGTRLAAQFNQHTEAILKSSYDTGGSEREAEILKKIEISFA